MSFSLNLFTNAIHSIMSSQAPKIDFYDSLQDLISSKKDYCKAISGCLVNLLNCIKDFKIRIKNLTSNLETIEPDTEEKKIHNLMKSIHKGIIEKFEDSTQTLIQINNHFSNYTEILNNEIEIYKEFKKIFDKLEKNKKKLEKNKESYHKQGKEAEIKIIQFVKYNITNLNAINQNEFLMGELDQITVPPSLSYQAYEDSLNKTNKDIEIYNQIQCKFFNYLSEIIAKDDVFYFNLVNSYVNLLENENKYLNKEISSLKDSKNFDKNENKSELKNLVESYEKNKTEEKIFKFENYPTKLDFSNCKDKKDFEICFESMNMIKKYINKNIFPNYDHETEFKNFKIIEIIKNLFSNNQEQINQRLSDDFLVLIEEPSVYHSLFVILSKLRTNSSFAKHKSLISLLGQGFEIVINKSKKNKLYDNIKNCIILSQTYYYEDENKKKIYIFEFIKNNKFLKSAKFWRNFISYMIENDLERFKNQINVNNNKVKDFTKLGDVVFSQLLTYANNMKNFEIDKRVIIKIIDEFIDKYKNVSDINKKTIYEMILQGKEGEEGNMDDLEKLRKEYDPSLENDSGINNDIDKKEKDENKDKENKKKEENAEIKENVENKEEEIKEEKKEENKDEQNNINNEKNE